MGIGSFCLQRRGRHKAPEPTLRFEATIQEIGAKGDGVAAHNGQTIFVPYTAPRDRVLIQAQGDKGHVLDLIAAGPDRAVAPCPHYGRCGGCGLQHVNQQFYRQWKVSCLQNALEAFDLGEAVIEPLVAIDPATRRRVQFYVRRDGDDCTIGFHERRSHRIASINACLVLHPKLNHKIPALKTFVQAMPEAWQAFSLSVTLCDNGLDVSMRAKHALAYPNPMSVSRLGEVMRAMGIVRLTVDGEPVLSLAPPVVSCDGIKVSPPPGGFLQASIDGQASLIRIVRSAVQHSRRIADLFSGCGTFSLPLARDANVVAMDSDEPAISALREAAGLAQSTAGIAPINAVVRNLFQRPLGEDELKAFDAIVIDPPRAGAIQQMRELAKSNAETIVSVSCNPKTFARDARILVDGGYQLERITPIDQFVYSSHLEMVGVFRK